jgi:hypothetical protein
MDRGPEENFDEDLDSDDEGRMVIDESRSSSTTSSSKR